VGEPRRSSAWPLALAFALLVVYASLYPFERWHLRDVTPWAYLWAPLPRYWTWFDVTANLLGYAPLGLLLTVAGLRAGAGRWAPWRAVGLAMGLSLLIETTQAFLPMRVASNLDLALNTAGAALGAALARWLEHLGALARWSRFRSHWFVPQARGSLVLLALWPPALLYPVSVPFGLGQVAERVEATLAEWMQGTPFLQWLPTGDVVPAPLSSLTEAFCVALGLLAPLLLGYADLRTAGRRALFLLLLLVAGWLAVALSTAMTYGPSHAWSWVTPQALLGLGLALLAGLALLGLPRRLCLVAMLLCLAVSLSLLNRSPASPYFSQALDVWEQGRFIRFHGLSQWLGWCWPFAALAFGLHSVARRDRVQAAD